MTSLPPLQICDRLTAEQCKLMGWTGVITLADPGRRDDLAFHAAPHPEHLVIHCNAGISRSTAAAMAILSDLLEPGREGEALAAVLEIQRLAVPNLLVTKHADIVLERNGALMNVVLAWDRPRVWNQWRRTANRLVTLYGPDVKLPPEPSRP